MFDRPQEQDPPAPILCMRHGTLCALWPLRLSFVQAGFQGAGRGVVSRGLAHRTSPSLFTCTSDQHVLPHQTQSATALPSPQQLLMPSHHRGTNMPDGGNLCLRALVGSVRRTHSSHARLAVSVQLRSLARARHLANGATTASVSGTGCRTGARRDCPSAPGHRRGRRHHCLHLRGLHLGRRGRFHLQLVERNRTVRVHEQIKRTELRHAKGGRHQDQVGARRRPRHLRGQRAVSRDIAGKA